MPPKVSLLIKRTTRTGAVASITTAPITTAFQEKKRANTVTTEVDGIVVVKRAHNKMNFYLEDHDFFAEEKKTSGTIRQTHSSSSLEKDMNEEEREEYLDKLETLKHKITKKLDRQANQAERSQLEKELREVKDLLSKLKKTDVDKRVENTTDKRTKIDKEFKKSKHALEMRDFRRIVDLTAPKEEREPDVNTTIWKQAKHVFKDSKYREMSDEQARKFEKRMQNLVKPMPKEMAREIRDRGKDNIKKISISKHHPELLKYKTYDPATFDGLALI